MAASTNNQPAPDDVSVRTSWKSLVAIGSALIVLIAVGFYAASTRSATSNTEVTQASTDQATTTDDTASHEESAAETLASAKAEILDGMSTATFALESDADYTYLAGAGESYTVLARQAIAKTDSELTTAERVAAETCLTQNAGAPLLEIAEEVVIAKADVQAAVDWAKALSSSDKADWQYYADQVDW